MYAKGACQLKYQDAKYPSAETRSTFLSQYKDDMEKRSLVRNGMNFILGELDLYTFKIYEQRDMAVQCLNNGDIEGAKKWLDKIGSID